MSDQAYKQALPAGFRLGSYRVVRVLGVGGFGITYLCEQRGLGVQVAVKEYLPNEVAVRDGSGVHPKSTGDREGFEWGLSRFLDEARTLARFEHPNVVRVRDCFGGNRTAYIVMDYEDGESLGTLLERHGTLTEAQLKRVVLPVADGLRQVHAAGFLHRDVKPSNIFLRRSDETPVLLDFGSARQALGRRSRSMTSIVSAGYSPPEQYGSRADQGAWTDIYALSALCHRAITGEAPVEAPRRTGEVARSRADPQPSLAASGVPAYSLGFLKAVDSGLRLIERERPQSLDDWLAPMARATAPRQLRDPELTQASRGVPSSISDRLRMRNRPQGRRIGLWSLGCLGASLGIGTAWLVTELGVYGPVPQGRGGEAQMPSMAEGQVVPGHVSPASPAIRPSPAVAEEGEDAEWALYAGVLNAIWAEAVGIRMPKNSSEAVQWYREVAGHAEQGDPDAQFELGKAYTLGIGVTVDAAEAVRWHGKAAEQGVASAQYVLGLAYAHGEGVPKDPGAAARWYRKAAEQEHADAQFNLGALYHEGTGVPKDAGTAALWYREAAEQGQAEAQVNLALLYAAGAGVPKDAGEAALWLRRAADQGVAAAQFVLGNLYYDGDGVRKDLGEAVRWWRKAAVQGFADAQYTLGLQHRDEEDYVQAYVWLKLAAAHGNWNAARALDGLQKVMTPDQIAEARRIAD